MATGKPIDTLGNWVALVELFCHTKTDRFVLHFKESRKWNTRHLPKTSRVPPATTANQEGQKNQLIKNGKR
jgi:hypothetical protein